MSSIIIMLNFIWFSKNIRKMVTTEFQNTYLATLIILMTFQV
jgi:hypothetical protein